MFTDPEGRVRSVLTAWTSLASPDAVVALSRGRSLFRAQDLLELVELMRRGPERGGV